MWAGMSWINCWRVTILKRKPSLFAGGPGQDTGGAAVRLAGYFPAPGSPQGRELC